APEAVTVNSGTTASIAGERFAIHGAVKSTGVLDLFIEAANFQVDRELIADVEPLVPSIRRLETRPEITGPMSMNVHVIGPDGDPPGSVGSAATRDRVRARAGDVGTPGEGRAQVPEGPAHGDGMLG